jgi:uncharacterized protein (DUF2164 family)
MIRSTLIYHPYLEKNKNNLIKRTKAKITRVNFSQNSKMYYQNKTILKVIYRMENKLEKMQNELNFPSENEQQN